MTSPPVSNLAMSHLILGFTVKGDYDQVLDKCRNALEVLSNARPYEGTPKNGGNPSFADKIDYLLQFLPGAPTGFRGQNLARMCKDLYGFTSVPEHPNPPHLVVLQKFLSSPK
mgnify:CR=1 FL=1